MLPFSILRDWIAWRPSNGFNTTIGQDPMVGVGAFYRLSYALIEVLHSKVYYYLAQIGSTGNNGTGGQNWKNYNDLGLQG